MNPQEFLIRIVLDAESKIAPVMAAAAAQADKLSDRFKAADRSAGNFDKRLVQLENHVSKTRDTMRSINPTLDAFDRKLKSASGTITVINRNLNSLANNSAKAAGALGGLATLIDRLERKAKALDAHLTEMGMRKYKPEIELQTNKAEAKIDALIAKLAAATRGRHVVHTDAEIGAAERKIESLRRQLHALGAGDRADRLIIDIEADLDVADQRERLKARLNTLLNDLRVAGEEGFSIRALLDTGDFDAGYGRIKRELFELAGIDVEPEVHLGTAGFEVERHRVEAELRALGLKRADIKVALDYDRSAFDRIESTVQRLNQSVGDHLSLTYRGLINTAINLAVVFSEPLLSALTAVGGALTAVATAAGMAALGLAGLATAAVSQAVPALGVLIFAFKQFADVVKVAQLREAEMDKGAQQRASIDNQRANALDALRNAHQGVADAQRAVERAQDQLNKTRRDGLRTLQDMVLAEQRAKMAALDSQQALDFAVATGSGGSIRGLQLQARADRITASRATEDRARVGGNVEKLDSVISASRAVDDAQRSLRRANDQVDRAVRGLDYANQRIGAAASAYETALGKLSDGQRRLLSSVIAFQALFTDNASPIVKITDKIVVSFAEALDRVREMLGDEKILASFNRLADALAKAIEELATFMTTGPMRKALAFFMDEGAKNIEPLTRILKALATIFTEIARAAAGPLADALEGLATYLGLIADKASSPKGRKAMREFFEQAMEPIKAFLGLGKAVIDLFMALMGPGGGADAGTHAIKRLTELLNDATEYVREHGDEVRDFFFKAVSAAGAILDIVIEIGGALLKTFDPESVRKFSDFINGVVIPVFAAFVKTIGVVVRGLLDLANSPAGSFLLKFSGYALAAWLVFGKLFSMASSLFGLFGRLDKMLGGRLIATLTRFAPALLSPWGLAAAAIVILLAKLGFLDDAIDAVVGMFEAMWDEVKPAFDDLYDAIGEITKAFGGSGDAIEDLKPILQTFFDVAKRVLQIVGRIVGESIARPLRAVARGIRIIVALFQGDLPEAGRQLMGLGQDILDGLLSPFELLADLLGGFFQDAIDWVKGILGIESPSTVFRDIGQAVIDGFIAAIKALPELVVNIFLKLPGLILEAVGSLFADLGKSLADNVASGFNGVGLPGMPGGGGGGGLGGFFSSVPGGLGVAANFGTSLGSKVGGALGNAIWGKDDEHKPNSPLSAGTPGYVDSIRDGVRKVASWLTEGASAVDRTLSGIADTTSSHMEKTRDAMDKKSDKGRKQLTKNMKRASDAVARHVHDAEKVADKGLERIRKSLAKELELYGIDDKEIKRVTRQTTDRETAFYLAGHAGGGFVGMQGERGGDFIPALIGRGEAVLNWTHQKIVDPAMRWFYGMGLGDMFKRTRSQHGKQAPSGFASGYAGMSAIPGQGGNGTPAGVEYVNSRIAGLVKSIISRYHALVTDGYDPTGTKHKSAGHQSTGTAVDFVPGSGGSWDLIDKLAAWAVKQGYNVLYDGRFGTTAFADHGRGHHLHVDFGGGAGGAVGRVAGKVRNAVANLIDRLVVRGPDSALKAAVQASLDTAVNAANKAIEKAGGGGGPSGSGKPAPPGKVREWLTRALRITDHYSKANLEALYARTIQESGGNPKAINLWDSNAKAGHPSKGLLQTIDSTFNAHKLPGHGNIWNPVDNAIAAIRYMFARYGHIVGASNSGYRDGGAVDGPGTGKSDSIWARLSKGEHVWTADEVQRAGGHGVMRMLRRLLGGGGQGGPLGYADGGRVLGVGDSLLVGTGPNLRGVVTDAAVGRNSDQAIAILKRKLTDAYKAVILDIGTNDATAEMLARNLRRARKLVGDRELVLSTVNGPGAAAKNRVLRGFANRFDNVNLVDWAGADKGLVGGDGIHATTQGYAARARMFSAALRGGGGGASISTQLSRVAGRIDSDGDIAGAIGAFTTLLKSLRKLGKGSKEFADAIDRLFDPDSKANPFAIIENAIQRMGERATYVVERMGIRVRGRGVNTRAVRVGGAASDPSVLGQIDIANLSAQRGAYQRELRFANRSAAIIERQLEATTNDKDRQVLEGRLRGITAKQEEIRRNILEADKAILDRQDRMQQEVADRSASFFSRLAAGMDRIRRRNTAAGNEEANIGLFDRQAELAQVQLKQLRKQFKDATKTGNTDLANELNNQIEELETTIAELPIQKVQAQVDLINSQFDRRNANIDRSFRVNELLGIAGTAQSKIDAQITSAQDKIAALNGALTDALATGNQDLADDVRGQITDLNNSIIELTQQRIQASIDEINRQAQHQLSMNDISQRLNSLGVTAAQAASGVYNVAALGRMNFGAQDATLRQRNDILTQQRSQLQAVFREAMALGDVNMIQSLTEQLASLDADLVENTKAIRDNIDAAFAYRMQQEQSADNFFLSLNQAAMSINGALEGLSGRLDIATQGALLRERQQLLEEQGQTDRGLLADLITSVAPGLLDRNQLMSLRGNALYPFLQALAQNALNPDIFDDAQLDTIKSLIESIASNEQALLDNTKALKDLDGAMTQTFSSTAWQMFRSAVFTGNGGLLPRFQIPQAHTGATVLRGGLVEVQAAEIIKTPSQVRGDDHNAGDHIEVNITSPTQVLDGEYVGRKIAWAKSAGGRR